MDQAKSAPPKYPHLAGDEATLSSHRGKAILGLAVLIGAFVYFAVMAFQGATLYYFTVDELLEVGPTGEERAVRVAGKLVPGSFERDEGSTTARFSLTDGAETLSVVHQGVVPGLFFNEHSEIVLEGTYADDRVFLTQNVPIVKCPSKYVAAN